MSIANGSVDLADNTCVACDVGATRLTEAQISEYMREVPQWELERIDDMPILTREYSFKNFAEALAFTNEVGALAESVNHHPALTTEWGKVTVDWWTHKIKGLHANDFIMAAKTERLYANI